MFICENCGIEDESVTLCLDPYMEDVYNEEVEVYLCDKCYEIYTDDI